MPGGQIELTGKWSCWDCDEDDDEEVAEGNVPADEGEADEESVQSGRHSRSSSTFGNGDIYTNEANSSVENHVENCTASSSKRTKNGTDSGDDNSLESRKRRAKRFPDFLYAEDRYGSDSGGDSFSGEPSSSGRSHIELRKRRKPSNTDNTNYRFLSMGLRETGTQHESRRDKLKKCETVVKDAIRQEFSALFAQPVSAKQVPEYYERIKHPMDLRTIITKLNRYEYDNPIEIWNDCQLIVSNCEAFNEADSDIRKDADELRSFLKPKFEEIVGTKLT